MTSPTDAESFTNAAQAVVERDADRLNELGQRAGDDGDLAAAVAYFRASMVLGGDGAAHNLGVVLDRLHRYAAAADAFRVAADSGIDGARLNLANLLSDHLDEPLEAEREYRTLVASGDVCAMYNLGLLYLELGRDDDAVEMFREASDRGDAEASERLAGLLADAGAEDERWRPTSWRLARATEVRAWRSRVIWRVAATSMARGWHLSRRWTMVSMKQ